jgi:hypothetical protein
MFEENFSIVVEEVHENFVHLELIILIWQQQVMRISCLIRIMDVLLDMANQQQKYFLIKAIDMSTVTLSNYDRNLKVNAYSFLTSWLRYPSQLGFLSFLRLKMIFKS